MVCDDPLRVIVAGIAFRQSIINFPLRKGGERGRDRDCGIFGPLKLANKTSVRSLREMQVRAIEIDISNGGWSKDFERSCIRPISSEAQRVMLDGGASDEIWSLDNNW